VTALSRAERRELLGQSPLFSALEPSDLDRFIEIARTEQLAPGEYLCRQGDPADCVYALVRGAVRVMRTSPDGRDVTIRILSAGEVFGELGVLHRGARTAHIVAAEPCELLTVARSSFLALLERHPGLAVELLGALAARIDALTGEIADLVFRNLETRLAAKLLDLSRIWGDTTEDGVRIRVNVTQQDLASLVGASRESVNKQLGRWERDGLLSVRRFRLTIHRPETLARLAEACSEHGAPSPGRATSSSS